MSEKRRAPARRPGRRESFKITFLASVAGSFVGTLGAAVLLIITLWVVLEWHM